MFSRSSKQSVLKNALVTLSAAAGLAISMAAPGNAVRQATLEKLPPLNAVISALGHAASDIARYTDATIIGALILCAAVFFFSRNGQSRRRSLNPIIVIVLSFGMFASLYVPPLYAMNDCDVPRIQNLFYLAYIFFMFGNSLYLADYAAYLLRERKLKLKEGAKWIWCAAGAAVFTAALICRLPNTNFSLARSELRGAAQAYRAEVGERKRIYNDKSVMPPRFTPISAYPACFHKSMILTWTSDVIVNGVPSDLRCIHSCGGEVTYIAAQQAVDLFDCPYELNYEDFSKTFTLGGDVCVPIRELANKIGVELIYDLECDTLELNSPG